MQIVGDARIAVRHLEIHQSGRLQINTGTISGISVRNYKRTANVPKWDWTDVTLPSLGLQHADLFSDFSSSFCHHNSVTVIRVPTEITIPLWKLGIQKLNSYDELKLAFANEAFSLHVDRIEEFCKTHLSIADGYKRSGISIEAGGNVTTTQDRSDQLFLGLHVDSWDKVPLLMRPQSRNRICVNLGSRTRYFLFSNLTIPRMVDALMEHSPSRFPKQYSSTTLVELFFEIFRSYPVIKLAIHPGEGYIAPTENLAHDGSSHQSNDSDVCFTALGYFGNTESISKHAAI
jgi:hypothetical protein